MRDKALHSLACAHCKPDGCLVDDSLAILVDALRNDPSIRVRRKMAGGLMWGQHGRPPDLTAAFETILAHDTDEVLRHRAAVYVASNSTPRADRGYRDWVGDWWAEVVDLKTRQN